MLRDEQQSVDTVRHLIESAEAQLRSARELLSELSGIPTKGRKLKSADLGSRAEGLSIITEGKVIEGIFDGEMMIGSDKKKYPVPANYASKSKFVPGDTLKLTIEDDGTFKYKQIKQIDRRRVVGSLVYEDGNYKVMAEGKTYKVLLASVTYYKISPGDQVTIALPAGEETNWAAIESAAMGFAE
ncbi:MAG: hypothetical protein WC045_00145 [Patescibacteria group bacterium]